MKLRSSLLIAIAPLLFGVGCSAGRVAPTGSPGAATDLPESLRAPFAASNQISSPFSGGVPDASIGTGPPGASEDLPNFFARKKAAAPTAMTVAARPAISGAFDFPVEAFSCFGGEVRFAGAEDFFGSAVGLLPGLANTVAGAGVAASTVEVASAERARRRVPSPRRGGASSAWRPRRLPDW